MTTAENILKLIGLIPHDLMVATHCRGYLNVSIKLDGYKIIEVASLCCGDETDGWLTFGNFGNGIKTCSCRNCSAGIFPIFHKEEVSEFIELINKPITKLTFSDELIEKLKTLPLLPSDLIINYIFEKLNIDYDMLFKRNNQKGYLHILVKEHDGFITDVKSVESTGTDGGDFGNWTEFMNFGLGYRNHNDNSREKLERRIKLNANKYKLSGIRK